MRAAVLISPGNLIMKNIDTPKIGPEEVLVKVEACGICATDVRKFFGKSNCKLPVVLGHEIGGYIAEVGKDVRGIAMGDRVTVLPDISCGTCYYCSQNKHNLCINLKSVGYGTDKIEPIDGGYAEFIRVPETAILKIPAEMSCEDATYVEPLSCAMRTLHHAHLDVDDSAAVFGDGRMGILHLQLLMMQGLKDVYVIGLSDDRLALAERFGATSISAAKRSPREVIAKRNPEGLDVVIDTTGDPAAMTSAVDLLQRSGKLVLFASSPSGSGLVVDPNRIHYSELVITGSYGYGSKMDFVKASDLVASRRVDVQSLTTSILDLDNLTKGFHEINERKSLRTIVKP